MECCLLLKIKVSRRFKQICHVFSIIFYNVFIYRKTDLDKVLNCISVLTCDKYILLVVIRYKSALNC